MTRPLRAALTIVAAAVLGLSAVAPAAAADGSIPPEVRDYVAGGGLVARLADVYGPNADGEGIDFDETTTTGAIVRVHRWTQAQLAGEDTDHPIELVNEWIVPISVAESPVGLAIVWINPDTVLPELASFEADPDLATALSAVPETAALVHDASSAAWFALGDDGVLTPLVPGSTGLTTPVPLDDVALLPPPSNQQAAAEPNTGLGLAIGVVAVLLVIIVVALVVPGRRGDARPGSAPAPDAEETDVAEGDAVEPEPGEPEPAEPQPETSQTPEPAGGTPAPKPRPKRAPRPKAVPPADDAPAADASIGDDATEDAAAPAPKPRPTPKPRTTRTTAATTRKPASRPRAPRTPAPETTAPEATPGD